jgi:hypothetical protein
MVLKLKADNQLGRKELLVVHVNYRKPLVKTKYVRNFCIWVIYVALGGPFGHVEPCLCVKSPCY